MASGLVPASARNVVDIVIVYPVELQTNRLVLREQLETDIPFYFELVHDEEAGRYQTWKFPNRLDDYAEICRDAFNARYEGDRKNYELVVTLDGEFMGYCGFDVENKEHKRAIMFYALAPQYWGRGYATEAASAVMTFAFEQLEVHRIAATTHPDNVASRRIMQKLGMEYEGHMRHYHLVRNEWRDCVLFACINTGSQRS